MMNHIEINFIIPCFYHILLLEYVKKTLFFPQKYLAMVLTAAEYAMLEVQKPVIISSVA